MGIGGSPYPGHGRAPHAPQRRAGVSPTWAAGSTLNEPGARAVETSQEPQFGRPDARATGTVPAH